MSPNSPPTFTCTVCAKVVVPKFLPSSAPNCPACGATTTPNEAAENETLTTFCAECHTTGNAYESEQCTNCGSDWGHWSGGDLIEQNPDSINENERILYKSTRGPEGGTIPRWKIL